MPEINTANTASNTAAKYSESIRILIRNFFRNSNVKFLLILLALQILKGKAFCSFQVHSAVKIGKFNVRIHTYECEPAYIFIVHIL